MNREIKIRVWDIDSSEMITDFNNAHSDLRLEFNNGKLIYIGLIEDNYPEERECVMMQYTGMKDKNGKEIYEGDIVKNASGRKGEVCYHVERACFIFRDTYNEQLFQHLPLEVIGNIHQNPELL